jgi:Sulfatase
MEVMRELLLAWIHLAVLWSFAVAKPLFDVLADSPEFFVARGNTQGDIVLLAFGLVLIPPTLLLAVEAALWGLPRARELVHLVFVGALTTAIAMQVFKSWKAGPGIPLTALALAAGVGAAILYARGPAARSTLTVLGPTPALFLFLFLVTSPVSDLFASDEDVPVRHDVRASAPVVAIVFDEFSVETLMDSKRNIDAERYPNFAELARSATWFRNATTISDHTTDAVPGILTGRYPAEDALPIASDQPHSLFTYLGGAYSLGNVTEPATDLCPSRLCSQLTRPPAYDRLKSLGKDLTIVGLHRVLPQRLAAELPAVDQAFGNFAGQARDAPAGGEIGIPGLAFEDRPRQFERFVAGIDGDRPDSLSFIHILLPHTAWQYLPTGQQYTPPAGEEVPGVDDNGVWRKDGALPQQALQRELLQVGYVDRLIGRVIRRLRSEGLYDKTLFILTADHGISFRPGSSRRTAAGPGAPDVLGVPLFVKAPGQERGEVDDRNATTADVLPTVADVLGTDLGWPTSGRSLLSFPRPPSDPVTVSVFPTRRKVSLPFAEYVERRDAEVTAMRFREGPGAGWGAVYAMGADSDLFGRPVSALPQGAGSGVRVELDHADAYDSVDPQAPVVPAFVAGTLTGPVGAGQRLVVAVNGVVRGAALTYDDGGDVRFGTVVPAAAFRRGGNAVAIYVVAGEGGSRRLSPVEGQALS